MIHRIAGIESDPMTPRPLAAFALVLALAGCVDQDEDLAPVVPPLLAETVQRAEAGDPAAQFKLAEYHRSDDDPTVMLRWLRESAKRSFLPLSAHLLQQKRY